MNTQNFTIQTKELIDNLKGICANAGLGNDGNEFKIITQVFLYKFMNDKFGYEVKHIDARLQAAENWEEEISKYSDSEYEMLLMKMSPDSAKLKKKHYLLFHSFDYQINQFLKYYCLIQMVDLFAKFDMQHGQFLLVFYHLI